MRPSCELSRRRLPCSSPGAAPAFASPELLASWRGEARAMRQLAARWRTT